jgi:outer membrane protein OmpA-like peptidoglycan-associated protein
MIFVGLDFGLMCLFDEELSEARRSPPADTGVVQPSVEGIIAEHTRFGQSLWELNERLRAVEVARDTPFLDRFDRRFLDTEERLNDVEDHLVRVRSWVEKSQPERRVEGLHPDELPETVSLILQGLFGGGSTDFQGIGFHILENLAAIIRSLPERHIEIVGHTDAAGSEEYNLELSARRAKAVRDYLMHHFGFPSQRFSVIGRGETEPIADNDSVEGRYENRRVEVILRR